MRVAIGKRMHERLRRAAKYEECALHELVLRALHRELGEWRWNAEEALLIDRDIRGCTCREDSPRGDQ